MKRISFRNFGHRIPVLLLTLALVLTGVVFGWFIWRIEQSKHIESLKQEILTNPEKTGDSIIYLREILRMATRNSVITGNLEWEKEYKLYEPRIAEKIEEIKTVLPDTVELRSIDELENTTLGLLATEKRAFTLMRDGRGEQAREILVSEEYERQKERFASEVLKVVQQLSELQKAELDSEYQYSNRFVWVAFLVFGLSIVAWITAIRNISNSHQKMLISTAEKVKTQAALIKSEQYQNLFRLANDAILVIEPETEIVLDANDKACEMYGYNREEFVGISIKTISENTERSKQLFELLMSNGSSQEFESVQYRADGMPINLLINSSIIEYKGSTAVLSINRDVTARKRADAALRESEYKMRTLLDSMSEGLIQVNNDEVIEFVNDRFCEMTGYDRQELIGQVSSDVLFDEYERKYVAGINNKRLNGESG
jgi:PAS domain S-box-containing protein